MRMVLNWVRLLAAAMGDDEGHERELRDALRRAARTGRSAHRPRHGRTDPEV
jgi:hypothetical protein